MNARVGSYCLVREKLPPGRWADPAIPKYKPCWMVMLRMPGKPRRNQSSMMEICDKCLALPADQSPTKVRPDCRCLKGARQFAEEWMKTEVHLWTTGRIEGLRGMRMRRNETSIRELVTTFQRNVPARMKDTARDYVNDLLAIVEQSLGGTREAVQDKGVSVLTRSLGLSWMRMRQAYSAEAELPAEQRRTWADLRAALQGGTLPGLVTDIALPGNSTINTMMRKVKSLLGAKARSYYLDGLEVPDLSGFLTLSKLPAVHGHVPLAPETLRAIETESATWKVEDLEMWLAYELLLTTGLRPKEVLGARDTWLLYEAVPAYRATPGWLLVVKNRPEEDFYLKARAKATVRYCPLDEELGAILSPRSGLLIAPALSMTARRNLVGRVLSKRLRKHLGSQTKGTNYELRKNFTSTVYTEHGKEVAASRAGHTSSDVTEAFYATQKGEVKTVTRAQLTGR